MKKLIATLALMCLAPIAASASGSDDTATTARSGSVLLTEDNFFEDGTLNVRGDVPQRVAIDRRDKITFTWQGSGTHNVKGIKGNTFPATELTDEDGHEVRRTFTKDSVVICQVHRNTMRLKVNVRQDR